MRVEVSGEHGAPALCQLACRWGSKTFMWLHAMHQQEQPAKRRTHFFSDLDNMLCLIPKEDMCV